MTNDTRPEQIEKVLSANDVGATGAHQVGFLIPKQRQILQFFPQLNGAALNPQCELTFTDPNGDKWTFKYVYYNNRLVGGTRNEYRLTRMTGFMRRFGLRAGDTVRLQRDASGFYQIAFVRRKQAQSVNGRLVLGSEWRVISLDLPGELS